MGCCISRPSGPDSPYPGGVGATGSSRAINAPQSTGPSSSQQGNDEPSQSPTPGSQRRHRHTQPLSQHINKPLRRHQWTSRNRTWTRAALRRERTDFFDTRVTGRQEVWQTLHAALDVLWTADEAARERQHVLSENDMVAPSEEEPAVALATAQSILNAADITLPTGDLAQGAYDALGNYYSLPEHIVCDPNNISLRPGSADNLEDVKTALTAGDDTTERDDAGADAEAERRREEKGKAVIDVRNLITIRARLSDGSKDVSVAVAKNDTVRTIALRVAEDAQLPPDKKIRIAYMGKILKEGEALLEQGWKQGHVVNALVFNV